MGIVIKQPPIYIDLAGIYIESYDHTLVMCECKERLMEKGVGLCEVCINCEAKINEKVLKEIDNE